MRVDQATLLKNNADYAKEITLHAKELCISHAEYSVVEETTTTAASPSSSVVVADEILFHIKATTVRLVFGQAIPTTATKIKLTIQFTGFLNNQMCVS
jgi:hypothetical protein